MTVMTIYEAHFKVPGAGLVLMEAHFADEKADVR